MRSMSIEALVQAFVSQAEVCASDSLAVLVLRYLIIVSWTISSASKLSPVIRSDVL